MTAILRLGQQLEPEPPDDQLARKRLAYSNELTITEARANKGHAVVQICDVFTHRRLAEKVQLKSRFETNERIRIAGTFISVIVVDELPLRLSRSSTSK